MILSREQTADCNSRAKIRRHLDFLIHITVKMTSVLSWAESLSLLSLSVACAGVLANTLHGDGEPLVASIAFSGLAFVSCYALIRWLGDAFMKRGFKGKDLCKLKQTEM